MIKNLDLSVVEAKTDKNIREELISDYKPFIRTVAKKTFSRYLEYGRDDELSVALIAFNESIDSYLPEKGHFLPFSVWVIKRRLIDYIRKSRNEYSDIPLETDTNDDEDPRFSSLDHLAIMEYKDTIESEFRRYEIQEFIRLLSEYGLTLEDMYKCSPKHESTRALVKMAISAVLSDSDLIKHVKDKKTLPLVDLTNILDVPRKTLERSRKYIVGTILLRTGDFNYLNSFVGWD